MCADPLFFVGRVPACTPPGCQRYSSKALIHTGISRRACFIW